MGHEITILEKLGIIGGRFTSFDKDGVPIPTGAVHMIPHRFGPMKRILIDQLHLPIDLIDSGRPGVLTEDGECIELGSEDAVALFSKSLIGNRRASRIMNAIYEFSLGLRGDEIPLRERIAFLNCIRKYSHQVTPRGGVRTVIDALTEAIRSHEGTILLNHRATSIDLADGMFITHAADKSFESDLLVANCSPAVLYDLLGDACHHLGRNFKKQLDARRPVGGIKIAVVCSHQVFDHSIVFTPFLNIISGFSEPTVADSQMASGKHLILTHQEIRPGPLEPQIQTAFEDLRTVIPDYDQSCKTVAVQVFRDDYPVNHASQGRDLKPVTKIPSLYLVGDGVKPRGHIMTEGVARSVEIVMDHIRRKEA